MKAIFLAAAFMAVSYSPNAKADEVCNWTGTWNDNGFKLRLVQADENVSGEWGEKGTLTGKTDANCRLTGQIDNHVGPSDNGMHMYGNMNFTMQGETYSGTWKTNISVNPRNWSGNRISKARPVFKYTLYPQASIQAMKPSASMIGIGNSAPIIIAAAPQKATLNQLSKNSGAPKKLKTQTDLKARTSGKRTPSIRSVFGCEQGRLITVKKNGKVWFIGNEKYQGPNEIYDHVEKTLANGGALRALALTPDCKGGVAVTDNDIKVKYYGSRKLPLELSYKLSHLRNQGKNITAIAFDPFKWDERKSYVIAYEGGYDSSGDLEARFEGLLKKALSQGEVFSIGFYPQKNKESEWVILGANGLIFTSNGSSPKFEHERILNTFIAKKIQPTYISFSAIGASPTNYAIGTNDCEAANVVTQRTTQPCTIPMVRLTYKRDDDWHYPCPKTASQYCNTYNTNVGLYNTVYTPKHWIKGRDIVRLQVCDPAIVKKASGRVKVWHERNNAFIVEETFNDNCKVSFDATKGEGQYIVHITIKGQLGSSIYQTQMKQERVEVKDIWVAILGDSYASGEGASFYDVKSPVSHEAKWLYDKQATLRPSGMRCNASPVAWGAKAAEYFATKTPHYGVKVSNFACSGSKLTRVGNIQKTFNGQTYVQAHALKKAIRENGGVKPDFILFTAGGNDVHFADIIAECLTFGCAKDSEGGNDEKIFRKARQGLRDLAGRYEKFNGFLTGMGIDPSRIVMPSYFDPTQGADGQVEICRMEDFFTDPATSCPRDKMPMKGLEVVVPFSMTTDSYKRAITEVGNPLKARQKIAAQKHGWFFVKRAIDVYKRHGNCSWDAYTNTICAALKRTGDFNGAFHPNKEGHAAAGLVIGQDMVSHYRNLPDTSHYFR